MRYGVGGSPGPPALGVRRPLPALEGGAHAREAALHVVCGARPRGHGARQRVAARALQAVHHRNGLKEKDKRETMKGKGRKELMD